MPGDPTQALASMGNYIFAPRPLIEALGIDADSESLHDFGRNVIPALLKTGRVYAYDFSLNRIPGVTDSASTPTGATSAPSRRTTRPTWT